VYSGIPWSLKFIIVFKKLSEFPGGTNILCGREQAGVGFMHPATRLLETGGLGGLTDRYVRRWHREGGQVLRASCALPIGSLKRAFNAA
jgi:hypothetical protein